MKRISVLSVVLSLCLVGYAQQRSSNRLRVFVDCDTYGCDMQFIRSEITVVDFLLDNKASDLHILITRQNTGSGGNQFQLIFFGQRSFQQHRDTLRFTTDPNTTQFEIRDFLLVYIKAGLAPVLAKAAQPNAMNIQMKETNGSLPGSTVKVTDPWNNWVLRANASGFLNADANYNYKTFSAGFSANRITEKIKTGFGISASHNKSVFSYEENGIQERFVVNNYNWWMNHFLVKSINKHWSAAYEARYSQNSFNNIKARAFTRLAVEYDVFPYSQVNNRLLTFSYSITARRNHYYDSTIYNKLKETLLGHRAMASLSLNQKWGNTSVSMFYHNYFTNWKYYNLGFDIYTNVRITGGLSFFLFAIGGLTRDQLSLVKGDATPEEVLARRRQLASGYNYLLDIGFTYRFGSKLNNVVNPRFDRSGSGVDD